MQLALSGNGGECAEGFRVLLLEDSREDAERSLCVLRRAGMKPKAVRVATREGFLRQVTAGDWDVVLADHWLPQFNSLEALDALKQQGLEIPVVMVTEQLDEETAIQCLQRGAASYVRKDRLGRLPSVVRQVVRQQRVRRERDEAIAALKQSEEKYRTLVEAAPTLIISLDREGRIDTVNQATEAVTGYQREEVVGRNWFELFVPADELGGATDVFESLVRGEVPSRHVNAIVTRSGQTRIVAWSNTTIKDERGEVVRIVGVGEDVTERRRLEGEARRHREPSDSVQSKRRHQRRSSPSTPATETRTSARSAPGTETVAGSEAPAATVSAASSSTGGRGRDLRSASSFGSAWPRRIETLLARPSDLPSSTS